MIAPMENYIADRLTIIQLTFISVLNFLSQTLNFILYLNLIHKISVHESFSFFNFLNHFVEK